MTIPSQIEREILIDAPVTEVWAAVTEASHIGTWFGNAGATIDLRPGGAMTCTWRNGEAVDTVHGVVEKVDEPHLFSYRWARPGVEPTPGNTTLVEFTLHPDGAGTRLRVVESGFAELDRTESERADHIAENTDGWRMELDELRAYLTSR
ncbi:MAG: activator of HSP90 ATPase [Actinophytocola sp.]|uniref:SRPBCC domain-containing protein n=1 Tax=Actinophytocola sp. TaxID=1872138 RepID=UPI001323D453|nr:SRPBCC domain-containing protein [Actinophytocola sp.]MPZ79406.1 activator of HSP90 ATPase [Actinophytocola sp.]